MKRTVLDVKIGIFKTGDRLVLKKVKAEETILEMKERICAQKGYTSDEQILFLDAPLNMNSSSPSLTDTSSLYSYLPSPDTRSLTFTLNLSSNPVKVLILPSQEEETNKKLPNSPNDRKLLLQHKRMQTKKPPILNKEISIQTFSCCSVFNLKKKITKAIGLDTSSQLLVFNGLLLKDDKQLSDYGMVNIDELDPVAPNSKGKHMKGAGSTGKDVEELRKTYRSLSKVFSIDGSNRTTTSRPLYEIYLYNKAKKESDGGQPRKLSFGIDFSFNTIKNVKKVNWTQTAPWYREISDGFCWICYCNNNKCPINKQMFVKHRGIK
jgi:hypothetical protein